MSRPAQRRSSNLDELRQEIKRTRAELGETVEALAAKLDVKARLEEARADASAQVRARLDRAQAALPEPAQRAAVVARQNWRPLLGVAGAALVVVLFIRWRNGRRGS